MSTNKNRNECGKRIIFSAVLVLAFVFCVSGENALAAEGKNNSDKGMFSSLRSFSDGFFNWANDVTGLELRSASAEDDDS